MKEVVQKIDHVIVNNVTAHAKEVDEVIMKAEIHIEMEGREVEIVMHLAHLVLETVVAITTMKGIKLFSLTNFILINYNECCFI